MATPQRETYAPPTLTGAGSSQTAGGSAFRMDDDVGPVTQYLCGECNNKVKLKKGDPIRCVECGHRVLYKERTTR